MQQSVVLAERPVNGIFGKFGATHWGLRVGTIWYELVTNYGADKGQHQTVFVLQTPDTAGKIDTWSNVWLVGHTLASPYEVTQMGEEWVAVHPNYHLTQKNCQHFVNYILRRLNLPTRRRQLL